MANVSSATNFFAKSEENSVPMTLGGSVLAGASTVPVNGMTNYTDGDIVAFTVDPATASLKQVFTGTKSGSNVINAVWTEVPTGGVNVGHSAGATVIDYVSATHWDLLQKGVTTSLNQDGSMKSSAVQTALNISSGATGGWNPLGFAPTSVTANGNRSYTLTFNAHDLTPQLSPGMRLQFTRTVAAPTQCTSLNGTTQYYSKAAPAGMTFTNNFVVSAWVKLSSYAAGDIASRYNGTSGWELAVNASGQVVMNGYNAGSTNVSGSFSYQSVPLNKWVHIAAQLDMATFTATPTTSYIMIDGVDIPTGVSRGGTNPTALVQAGNLEIGSRNGGLQPFPGKIAQVAIYSAKVTEATILASKDQSLAGTETSLISAYSFNNSINDLNANANNLTANGSAVATNADTPFGQTYSLTGYTNGTLSYGIVTSVSFSTNTTAVVQVPEGDTIPTSGGVSAVSYATVKVPYGFPAQRSKWRVSMSYRLQTATTSNATFAQFTGMQLVVPIGSWAIGYTLPWYNQTATTVYWNFSSTSQTGLASTASDLSLQTATSGTGSTNEGTATPTSFVDAAAALTYLMYTLGSTASAGVLGSTALCEAFAENAYL